MLGLIISRHDFHGIAIVQLFVSNKTDKAMETLGNNGESGDVLEQDNMTGENHFGKRPNTPVKFLTATSVIGDDVRNNLDENLGKIKDVMIDVQNGSIEYVVVE